jgi:hypothetical protein
MTWLSISPPVFQMNWARNYRQSVGLGRTKIAEWIFLLPWGSRSIFFGAGNSILTLVGRDERGKSLKTGQFW